VALRQVVTASVENALLRIQKTDPNRVWAEISKADTLFLTQENCERVVKRYRDAFTGGNLFQWDSARGQLELFAQLGLRAECAETVIQTIDRQFAGSEPKPTQDVRKPLHVVLFAGHRVDAPDRPTPRFPASRAERAKGITADMLKTFGGDDELLGLASAASGGDILFHEACSELGIPSILCLPIRADRYAAGEFRDLDDWRSRFLTLLTRRNVCELSNLDVLPRWLHGSPVNAWERGNRWVLQMALGYGADKISLVTLWDGKPTGDAAGGTAHMVKLAGDAGIIRIIVLDKAALRDEVPSST
jgi:hypothetical protein